MELLLRADAAADKAATDGFTPLIVTAMKGEEKCVELLLAAAADVNGVGTFDWTPLYAAALKGKEKCVELLLGAGADLEKAANDGRTPLRIAEQNGHEKCVELLLGAGAVSSGRSDKFMNDSSDADVGPLTLERIPRGKGCRILGDPTGQRYTKDVLIAVHLTQWDVGCRELT